MQMQKIEIGKIYVIQLTSKTLIFFQTFGENPTSKRWTAIVNGVHKEAASLSELIGTPYLSIEEAHDVPAPAVFVLLKWLQSGCTMRLTSEEIEMLLRFGFAAYDLNSQLRPTQSGIQTLLQLGLITTEECKEYWKICYQN